MGLLPFAVLFLPAGAARVSTPTAPHAVSRAPLRPFSSKDPPPRQPYPPFAGGRSRGFASASGENPQAVRGRRSCQVTTARSCLELCLLQVFGDRPAHVNHPPDNRPSSAWRKWVARSHSHHPSPETASGSNPLMGLCRCFGKIAGCPLRSFRDSIRRRNPPPALQRLKEADA